MARDFKTPATVNGVPLAQLVGGGSKIVVSETEPTGLASGDVWVQPGVVAPAHDHDLSGSVGVIGSQIAPITDVNWVRPTTYGSYLIFATVQPANVTAADLVVRVDEAVA